MIVRTNVDIYIIYGCVTKDVALLDLFCGEKAMSKVWSVSLNSNIYIPVY